MRNAGCPRSVTGWGIAALRMKVEFQEFRDRISKQSRAHGRMSKKEKHSVIRDLSLDLRDLGH